MDGDLMSHSPRSAGDARYVNVDGDSMTNTLNVAGNVNASYGQFTGLSAGGAKIVSVAAPSSGLDAANRDYVDTAVGVVSAKTGVSTDANNALKLGADGKPFTTPKFLVLGPSDPVPGGTTAGTVIIRKQ